MSAARPTRHTREGGPLSQMITTVLSELSSFSHLGRLRSMMSAAPFASSSSPTARPSSRAIGGPGARSLDEHIALFVQHRGGQRHPRAFDRGKPRDRRIAVAIEHPEHLALGIGAS